MKEEIKKIIEKHLQREGIKMIKKISSGGIFTAPTYDYRTVYSLKDLFELSKQGFLANQSLGIFLFNVFTIE